MSTNDMPLVKTEQQRNYQLDFLKLIFTFLVFFEHTKSFIGENTRIILPPMLGSVAVHFFFIVSGMLMVNSIIKKDCNTAEPGKSAMMFILNKFKNISWQYWTAMFLNLFIYIYISQTVNTSGGKPLKAFFILLFRIFPESFLVFNSGVFIKYNTQTWYLSAMFICMLPLAYMLYKHKDFTLNVFAPLAALFSLGFMYQNNNFAFFAHDYFQGLIFGGIIRAVCGLCFGIITWSIYNRIVTWKTNKNGKILLTISEIILYLIFFIAWFVFRDIKTIDSVLFILPIAIAISFSGQSYIGSLFRFKWMRYFSPISLAIYLNHWAPMRTVIDIFPGCSYKMGVALMAAFTAIVCVIYFIIITLGKKLWNKKIKSIFINQEVA